MKSSLPITPVGADTTFGDVWQWGQRLERLHAHIAPRFVRPEPRRRTLAFLKGIVSAVERKNGWQLAEHVAVAKKGATRVYARAFLFARVMVLVSTVANQASIDLLEGTFCRQEERRARSEKE